MSKTQLRNRNIKLRTLEKVLYDEENKEWIEGYVTTIFNAHLDREEFIEEIPRNNVIIRRY